MIVNRQGLADAFGAATTTVDAWVREGCPSEKKGREYAFDTAEVHKWLVKRALAEKRRRGNRFGEAALPEGQISYDEAKRRKEAALAKNAELDLAQKLGLVAPIDTITKVVSGEIGNARAKLLAVPARFRPDAQMHASSPERAKKLVAKVEDLIHEALSEIKSFSTPV